MRAGTSQRKRTLLMENLTCVKPAGRRIVSRFPEPAIQQVATVERTVLSDNRGKRVESFGGGGSLYPIAKNPGVFVIVIVDSSFQIPLSCVLRKVCR
jgi:hypothetical protein